MSQPIQYFSICLCVHLAHAVLYSLRPLHFFICMWDILLSDKTDSLNRPHNFSLTTEWLVSSFGKNSSWGHMWFSPVCLWPPAGESQNTEGPKCLLKEWMSERDLVFAHSWKEVAPVRGVLRPSLGPWFYQYGHVLSDRNMEDTLPGNILTLTLIISNKWSGFF